MRAPSRKSTLPSSLALASLLFLLAGAGQAGGGTVADLLLDQSLWALNQEQFAAKYGGQIIHGLPMVDQGQKGYCAAAAAAPPPPFAKRARRL